MTRQKRLQDRQKEKILKIEYQYIRWDEYDYSILNNILAKNTSGKGRHRNYNDAFIMLDTETSKKEISPTPKDNHVVAFTISIRSENHNICTLYGARPDDCIKCINRIVKALPGETTYFYVHNLNYDWTFLYRFMIDAWGYPSKQLNVKPLYPIVIEFEDPNIILKDSYILAQRSLDKWSKDMNVEHQKANGKWDYDKIRDQSGNFSPDELEYIEHDTLAGVECLDTLKTQLNKHVYSMPYTATGIPREDIRKIGKKYHAHDSFIKMALTWDQLQKAEKCFHGGYTHANRHFLDRTITGRISCRDFASSYPYIALTGLVPMEKFTAIDDCDIKDIIKSSDKYGFMFKLILVNPRLKDDSVEMPVIALAKCIKSIDVITDNGRVLAAGFLEVWINEIDARIINQQYVWDKHLCTEVECARKSYLPKWLRDYLFGLFVDKTKLKGEDPVLYMLSKAKLNAASYGMMAQHPVRQEIVQDYKTGEYTVNEEKDLKEEYEKFIKRHGSILNYAWGCWITSIAQENLHRLGACCEYWIYSDTDSVYGMGWDEEKLNAYNEECKQKLIKAGYGPVKHNNRDYWLGVAEFDGEYSEFRTVGSKRYCGRSTEDGELHITVAGVPKKTGAQCLKNNIKNFTSGMIFDGKTTGKKTHFYLHSEIYTDEKGNITADSIDLEPCDYLLQAEHEIDWEKMFFEEVSIPNYEIL